LLQLCNVAQTVFVVAKTGVALAGNHGGMLGANLEKRRRVGCISESVDGIGATQVEGMLAS